MKEEKSCGAVVYREEEMLELLLIKHKNGGHWSFPKGHVEANETEEETAKREILEETGVQVCLDTRFREAVRYAPKPKVMKTVIYFAARYTSGCLIGQKEEVTQLGWFTPELAYRCMAYESDRSILRKFEAYRGRSEVDVRKMQ